MKTGEELRDEGIEQAVTHAEKRYAHWSDVAYGFLLEYMRHNKEFMAEEVREAATLIVPEPPSNRAWGGVIVRAVHAGLIERKGFKSVKNPKAHCAPCSIWIVK